jgi:predicted glycogen debranching enzyme
LTLIAATEAWHTVLALSPDDALTFEGERRRRLVGMAAAAEQIWFAAELVLATDTFVITPVGRIADGARARAEGDEIRTVIAGYHWFTDWGRDTMISLDGLTLATGRAIEARWILRTFAHYERDGLIPNLFPEEQNQGLYHTADATLWFFHALHRYVQYSRDRATLELLLPILKDIVRHHLEGTRFGIRADPLDGLLTQDALTWMDAKVADWVVTPRRGKAVEINALWYNALRLLADWLREAQDPEAEVLAAHADKTRASFNRRFWRAAGGHLYDVVDGENGDDAAFRPNQIFAIALEHPVLDPEYWEAVVTAVHAKLVTPVGLRSLAPGEPDYKPRYFGDLRARDAAYHQGRVWAWLIGPSMLGSGFTPMIIRRRGISSTVLSRTSLKPESARSAKSSTPSHRSRRAAASRRPGASQKCCAAWQKPPKNGNKNSPGLRGWTAVQAMPASGRISGEADGKQRRAS